MSSFDGDVDDQGELKMFQFMQWLHMNGATFPKIRWPSNDTASGIRGAIALEDISTNEYMIEIPEKLMMTPPQIMSHPLMGDAIRNCLDILHGDLLLAVYIMHEFRLGSLSFYSPSTVIFTEPDCISVWRDCDLSMLQVNFLLFEYR